MATTSMKLSISDTRIPAAIAPPGFMIYRLSPLSLSTNIRSRPYRAAYDNIASPSCLNFLRQLHSIINTIRHHTDS